MLINTLDFETLAEDREGGPYKVVGVYKRPRTEGDEPICRLIRNMADWCFWMCSEGIERYNADGRTTSWYTIDDAVRGVNRLEYELGLRESEATLSRALEGGLT